MGTAFLLKLLTAYHLPTAFFGAFFFGESVIVTAAYLTAQLGWSVTYVALAAFLGTIASDTIWFFAGRILKDHFARMERFAKEREKAAELLRSLTGTRPLVALLFIKFLYGSRIAMIFYLAARDVRLPAFTLFNAIGTAIWLGVIFPLGYLAGKGVGGATSTLKTIEIAVVVLVGSALLFKLISLWLTKRITNNDA